MAAPGDDHDAQLAPAGALRRATHAVVEREDLEADVAPAGRLGRDRDERAVVGRPLRGMDEQVAHGASSVLALRARARARTPRARRAPRRRRRPRRPARPTSPRSWARPRSGRPRCARRPGRRRARASSSAARSSSMRRGADHARAEALGVGREVDVRGAQRRRASALRVGASSGGAAVRRAPVVRAEAAPSRPSARARRSTRSRGCRRARRRSAMPLGDRGDELAGQHQVRAVADEHEDVALGRGELDAHAARDLVAHARVAVLDVVALAVGVARAPELVQVARAPSPRRTRRRRSRPRRR